MNNMDLRVISAGRGRQLSCFYPLFRLMILGWLGCSMISGVQAALQAGPMASSVTPEGVVIWSQWSETEPVSVSYWPLQQPQAKQQLPTVRIEKQSQGIATFTLSGLAAETAYVYQLQQGDWRSPVYQFRTAPRVGDDSAHFRFLLGSCAYSHSGSVSAKDAARYQIYQQMSQAKADITLWLGDNVYLRPLDYLLPWGMQRRYRRDRALSPLQPVLQQGSHYAVWDDHDYGPNNSTRDFVFKQTALELFNQYWPNPSSGLPELPGIFTQFSYGDVDAFLLDNRFYRDSDDSDDPKKQLLGQAQLQWLQDALLASQARFKLLVMGSQWNNAYNDYEGWQHFPAEQQGFLQWLQQQRLPGVIFISGDRHHTELLQVAREAPHYPLYELTCSPLTSRARQNPEHRSHPQRVEGTLVQQQNYCLLDFSGSGQTRQLSVSSYDVTGQRLWQRSLLASELGYVRASAF